MFPLFVCVHDVYMGMKAWVCQGTHVGVRGKSQLSALTFTWFETVSYCFPTVYF